MAPGMTTMLGSLVGVAGICGSSAQNPMIELDMYRAMGRTGVSANAEQNDDLADLIGVIKYVHTECIAEHTMSPPTRETRKNGIDILGRWRLKVKNPQDVLQGHGNFVDFGPFQAYDVGQSTNAALDDIMMTDGDFVGIQLQANDARFPTVDPFYWASVSGFCPNLPWVCTKGASPDDCYGEDGITPTLRCKDTPCPGKGSSDTPNAKCLTYYDVAPPEGKFVMGGLCDEVGGDATGEHGCVYSYNKPEIELVSIDELVGITEQECRDRDGTRKCADWLDFRRHCTNTSYKRMFGSGGVIEENLGYCVEYDVHPGCVNDCKDPKCPQTGETELGMPFWQNRCDKRANKVRAERLAMLFKFEGAQTAHQIVHPNLLDTFQKCTGSGPSSGVCQPDMASGGPFCSRMWSGVCTTCYIPNTEHFYPANATQPTCPIDILFTQDYKEGLGPTCQSTRPRDLCCVYRDDCNGADLNPITAPLDEDGLAAAKAVTARKRDTGVLIAFLTRVANGSPEMYAGPYVNDTAGLFELAYWMWDLGLSEIEDIEDVKKKMVPFFSNVKPTAAPTPAPAQPAPPPAPATTGGGVGVWIIVLVVVAAVGGLVAAFLVRRAQNNRVQRERREQQRLEMQRA